MLMSVWGQTSVGKGTVSIPWGPSGVNTATAGITWRQEATARVSLLRGWGGATALLSAEHTCLWNAGLVPEPGACRHLAWDEFSSTSDPCRTPARPGSGCLPESKPLCLPSVTLSGSFSVFFLYYSLQYLPSLVGGVTSLCNNELQRILVQTQT